jgi:phosphatidylglycerophosphate synthase
VEILVEKHDTKENLKSVDTKIMKTKIPQVLIFSRLIIGLMIIVFSSIHIDNYKTIAILLLTIGLLTDIFDGIIARQLNVSTQRLRRLDSTVDQLFFISVIIATYIQCPDFFRDNAIKLIILISVEAVTYLISYLKFKKEIATHSIGAKIWTLFLYATLIQIMVQYQSTVLFTICFWVGLLTRFEIIAIILILKEWTNDVPTFFHSLKLRQNKEIKRHKMFNG